MFYLSLRRMFREFMSNRKKPNPDCGLCAGKGKIAAAYLIDLRDLGKLSRDDLIPCPTCYPYRHYE